MTETAWKPNQDRVHDLADAMAKRLRSGMGYEQAMRLVFQGLRGDERAAYVAAVASELSLRRHISEARQLPDAPVREATPIKKERPKTPAAEQLGFPGEEFHAKPERPDGWPVRRRAA